jgi:hypothetical protein
LEKKGDIEGEEAVLSTGLHWVILLAPAIIMFLSGLSIPTKGWKASAILGLATLWGVLSSISYEQSRIFLTKTRLRVRVGFPLRRKMDLPLEEVESIDVYQPSLGKVLDFGKVMLKQKGSGRKTFRMVNHPLHLAYAIQELKKAGQPPV